MARYGGALRAESMACATMKYEWLPVMESRMRKPREAMAAADVSG